VLRHAPRQAGTDCRLFFVNAAAALNPEAALIEQALVAWNCRGRHNAQ
jgi:hypothetical protein